jgi:hypothetical protein
MRYLFVDTYYPAFLSSFRRKNPQLERSSYKIQLRAILDEYFGTSDFYSRNLIALGQEAQDLIVNDEILQKRWAKENNINIGRNSLFDRLRSLPYTNRVMGNPSWSQKIVLEQIKKYKPDIVYMQNLSVLNPKTLREIKKYSFLVGQIASPPPAEENLKEFDLILTSLPNFVTKFRKMGIKSEYFRIGFEMSVLKEIGSIRKKYDVTFVGSFTPQHGKGTEILEQVAKKISVHVWGQGIEYLDPASPLRRNYHGEAWGLDMYRILAESKIVINRHIGIAGEYANNMRLYESTGMGAMLITDKKKNLKDMFKTDQEVVVYTDSEYLVNKVKYYLSHDDEREKIAKAGQKRTLKEHTYFTRMKELSKIIEKNVKYN